MRTKQDTVRLIGAFIFALIPFLICEPLLPGWTLTYFAPFLVISYYKKPMITSLWLALICGTLMDLASSTRHLGLHALTYVMTSGLLYGQKKHFFEDRISTIPLMTFFFSVLSTLFHVPLYLMLEGPLLFSPLWWTRDLIIMPGIDAFYGLVGFTLPGFFLPRSSRRHYFMDEQ